MVESADVNKAAPFVFEESRVVIRWISAGEDNSTDPHVASPLPRILIADQLNKNPRLNY